MVQTGDMAGKDVNKRQSRFSNAGSLPVAMWVKFLAAKTQRRDGEVRAIKEEDQPRVQAPFTSSFTKA